MGALLRTCSSDWTAYRFRKINQNRCITASLIRNMIEPDHISMQHFLGSQGCLETTLKSNVSEGISFLSKLVHQHPGYLVCNQISVFLVKDGRHTLLAATMQHYTFHTRWARRGTTWQRDKLHWADSACHEIPHLTGDTGLFREKLGPSKFTFQT